MLAPPAPGKRHEKLRFDLSLLFTEDGKEYSAQEARARSMGLLGKKWGPPPVSESTQRATFKDDLRKQDPSKTTRTLPMGEPTVTINTKQALADVFGMYNSPEKTVRSAQFPGSKHAPLKRVEPVAPIVRPPKVPAASENIVPGVPGERAYCINEALVLRFESQPSVLTWMITVIVKRMPLLHQRFVTPRPRLTTD